MNNLACQEIRILILYQGEVVTPFRKHLFEFIYKQQNDNYKFVPEIFQGAGNTFDHDTYNDFIAKCDSCDFAIAIVTQDIDRCASEAGNLWFEIGYWCGTKGRDKLMILVQNIDRVCVPSDAEGKSAPRFKDTRDMNEYVIGFLSSITSSLNNLKGKSSRQDYPCEVKIGSTVTKNCKNIELTNFFECLGDNKACEKSRRQLLCLSGELIRIGECSNSQNLIYAALIRLSSAIADIQRPDSECTQRIRQGDHGSKDMFKKTLEAAKDKLRKEIWSIKKTLEFIFSTYNCEQNSKGIFDRFYCYCEYRVAVAYRIFKEINFLEMNFENMVPVAWTAQIKHIGQFVHWIESVNHDPGKYIDYIDSEFLINPAPEPTKQDRFCELNETGGHIITFCEILSWLNREVTKRYIKAVHYNETSNCKGPTDYLQFMRDSLSSNHISFWPRSDAEKYQDREFIKEHLDLNS